MIKLLDKLIVGRRIDIDYLYPDRYEHKLSKVLSQAEVKKILSCTKNLKHRAIFSLDSWGCGFRSV